MYVVCMLDSDNYSEPDVIFADDIETARAAAKSNIEAFVGCAPEVCNTEEHDGERWVAQKENERTGTDFMVAEIYPLIPEATHVVIRWHGYDGVDFNVHSFMSFDEAAGGFLEEKAEVGCEFVYEYYDEGNQDYILFDTGDEWIGIEIKEVVMSGELKEAI